MWGRPDSVVFWANAQSVAQNLHLQHTISHQALADLIHFDDGICCNAASKRSVSPPDNPLSLQG